MPKKILRQIGPIHLAYAVWLVAIGATMGSLMLSQVWHYPPCDLCWYQRIMMYPLVLVVGSGIYLKDKKLSYYVLPLTIVGGLIAFYHTLLQWGVIDAITQCTVSAPCTVKYINWFGFITIPFMSLMTFTVIGLLMLWHYRLSSKAK